MRFSASCLPGMEEILAGELQDIGATARETQRQAVSFEANDELMVACLTGLPSALRIYQEITRFSLSSQSDLYAKLDEVPWSRYLGLRQSFAIEVLESGGKAPGPLRFITLKAKDSLVDHFRSRNGGRPSVDRSRPDIRFLLLFDGKGAVLYRDAVGTPLSHRGYRLEHGGAPLNEALGWGLLNHMGFARMVAQGDTGILIDPMCGSGTIPIEAALHLLRMGVDQHISSAPEESSKREPRIGERTFMCFAWPDKGTRLQALYRKYAGQANAPISGALASSSETPSVSGRRWMIIAADSDQRVLEIAKKNARRAGVEAYIRFVHSEFSQLRDALESSDESLSEQLERESLEKILLMNPPYDRRLTLAESETGYKFIGDILKNNWKGWKAGVFSANKDALKRLGLRSERKVALKNGQLASSLHVYSLY